MDAKKIVLLFGCCVLVIWLTIAGFVIKWCSSSQNKETSIDKDSLYLDYTMNTLAETIKRENGILDCKIYADYSNGEIGSADVNVVVENNEITVSEIDLLGYISCFLELSKEDIMLSFTVAD